MISIGVDGVWKEVTPYIGVGGSWVSLTSYWIGAFGTVWMNMADAGMIWTPTPATLTASGSFSAPTARNTVDTASVTVAVTGGSGTYTYVWTGAFDPTNSVDSTGTILVNSPTAATTTFTVLTCDGNNSPGFDSYIATCTITDSTTGQTVTATVPIKAVNTYFNPS